MNKLYTCTIGIKNKIPKKQDKVGIVGPDMMPNVDLIYEVNTHKNISIKEINILANKEKKSQKDNNRKHE